MLGRSTNAINELKTCQNQFISCAVSKTNFIIYSDLLTYCRVESKFMAAFSILAESSLHYYSKTHLSFASKRSKQCCGELWGLRRKTTATTKNCEDDDSNSTKNNHENDDTKQLSQKDKEEGEEVKEGAKEDLVKQESIRKF